MTQKSNDESIVPVEVDGRRHVAEGILRGGRRRRELVMQQRRLVHQKQAVGHRVAIVTLHVGQIKRAGARTCRDVIDHVRVRRRQAARFAHRVRRVQTAGVVDPRLWRPPAC